MRVRLSPAEVFAVDAARAVCGESQADAVARWAHEACARNATDAACAEALRRLAEEDASPRSKRGRPATVAKPGGRARKPAAETPKAALSAPSVSDKAREDAKRSLGRPSAPGGVAAVERRCARCGFPLSGRLCPRCGTRVREGG